MLSLRNFGRHMLVAVLAAGLYAGAGTGPACAGVAPAEGSAAMKAPASNAAVVAKLIGMVNNRRAKTMTGLVRTINDGIVIRQSYIKDGKIIIPPEGLYSTARSSNWYPFDNEPITMAGLPYRVIVDRYVRDVQRNVTMKVGDVITSNEDKSRGWTLASVEGWTTYGLADGKEAVFKILKTTGNFYGSSFPVKVGTSIGNDAASGAMVQGTSQPEGHTEPNETNNLSRFDYGHNVFSVGRSYVIVDRIDADNTVHVREFGTDSCTDIYMSSSEPVKGTYANGDTFTVGGATVGVFNITAGSCDVIITAADGTVTTKKLFVDEKNAHWLMQSMVERDKCYVVSEDGSILVHLDIRPGLPFQDGKVNLVAYSDVIDITNGAPWGPDPRFLTRPET